MVKDITIYTTSTCAYCRPVKELITKKGFSYTEVNLDNQPEKRAEAFAISGQMAVPVIVMTKDDNTKSVTVGFNPGRLASELS